MAGAFSTQDLLDVEALGRVEMMRGGGPHCTSLRLAIQKTAGFAIKSGRGHGGAS